MNQTYDTLIIGAGLSGLTVAHKLRHRLPSHRLLVLDKAATTGGVIRTHRENDYISEIGPHGFLDNCPESKEILKETGLDRETVTAPLSQYVRYVYLAGKLQCIPQSPLKILAAPLISWRAKLRVLAELWQEPLAGEPTVAKWVNHRFGPELLPFADAVFTGTYAGDYDELTIDAVMPGLRALEQEHGSVLRGLIARMRANRKKGGEKKKLAMPAMTSFAKGMSRLPERLSEGLQPGIDLLLSCAAKAVVRNDAGWTVRTDQGDFTATNLVLALPVNAALQLLASFTATMPTMAIPETWISNVVFGFGPGAVLPPGFGYLSPEKEGRFALGALFSSNMFAGRAPHGHILCETLIGGRRHPERLELDQESLIKQALADVQEVLKINRQPVYSRLVTASGGIPQLERGYSSLLAWRDEMVRNSCGLHICGFGWEGIGLNDMMKAASRVAEAITSQAALDPDRPAVKAIYF